MLAESPRDPFPWKCFSRSRCLLPPLPVLPAGATEAGWDSHPLKIAAFSRRTLKSRNEDASQNKCIQDILESEVVIMEIHELVVEMKLLERRMTLFEEKYGILSEDFYEALTTGKFDRYDEYDESRNDFSRWKGIYETWQRRKQAYREDLRKRDVTDTLRVQPAY